MIRLSVFYPAGADAKFDFDYYRDQHIPFCVQIWGLAGAEIDKGVDGPYLAAAHFRFESPDALQAAMGHPEVGKLMADLPNYTNIQPLFQTSEII